ncbi:MAG: CAP domain-containing protein [Paracoccaceae bacterium]
MFARVGMIVALLFTVAACEMGGTDGVHYIRANEGERIRANQLEAVNLARSERGLRPLVLSAALNAASDVHARDISEQRRAWDFGSDRSSPQTRAQRAGFNGRVTGENVAETFVMNEEILRVWLADVRARAAIINPDATDLGIGWHQDPDGRIWWVQMTGAARAVSFSTEAGITVSRVE